ALYRPGTGTMWILKNDGGAFTPVYQQGDPGNGIGGYDLASPGDRALAFDYDGSGRLDHLALYRPGTGTMWILKNDGGAFTPVYQQGDPGNGIGGYDLASPGDRAFAFDYDGSGRLDHLALYRPGTGTMWILKGAYVRRDVWSLQANPPWDPVTEAYALAIRVMQARSATDPTSWTFQAAMHGSYQPVPPGAKWNLCQHGQWFFLPWHRMYVYYFERIVRAAVVAGGGPADWALPYWNYDQATPRNTMPLPFRQPTMPDGSPNPLYIVPPQRAAAYMNGSGLATTITSSATAMDAFHTRFFPPPNSPAASSFGGGRTTPSHFSGNYGALELTPHNAIHVAIGGQGSGQCQGGLMSDPNCAAFDPIFWLHHANIDRLWNVWLGLGGGRANPTDAAWLGQSFDFYDETGAAVTLTGAEVVDAARQLGYVYA
ncbi:MAG: tyrosinase family protein, partial [Actinomycetota bacterium]